ncbi:FHA domain-containing protein [Pseudarthrobacter sp. YS3]|uniref:FHA domain-containing protein n=1 Tax=Pseudarthrobacter sp. YS3 TaxID=3453718 RepID=UPI003EEAC853
MAAANYTSGIWLGVIRSGTVVVLGPGSSPELARSLWELLGKTPEVHEVFHAVTSGFGVSLAQIPSFGIVDFRDSLRVFLRGDLDLTVQLPEGSVELNGRDVTTWTERRLAAPERYVLAVSGDSQPGALLPLGEGVVLLQSLTVAFDGPAAETAAPDPASAAGVSGPPVMEPAAASGLFEADSEPEFGPVPDAKLAPDAELSPDVAPGPETPIEAESSLEPDSEPEPHSTGTMNADREVSAETVMGVMDEDSHYAADNPEPVQPEAPVTFPDQVPAHELTGSYDHLWEKTVVRRIEDAAVRDEPEEEDPAYAAGRTAENESAENLSAENQSAQNLHRDLPAGGSGQGDSGPEESAATGSESGRPAAQVFSGFAIAPPASDQPGPPPVPQSVPAPPVAPVTGLGGGLIDSVPWRTGGTSASGVQAPASFNLPPAPALAAPASAPISTSIPGTAHASGQAAATDDFDPDHDGQTIMKGDLAGMSARPAPVRAPDAAVGPLVLARVCERGHANPPTHAQCALCLSPLPADAVQVARPRLGRMRVSTGELVDLDQSLVIGRQPSVSRVQGGGMPRLVQVASPSGDISRSHVEVRLEGWHVMLCDLKATNGTVLVREGQQPRRLAQNEMAILLDGDIAELGDDISLRFEEIL